MATIFGKYFPPGEESKIAPFLDAIPRFTYTKGFKPLKNERHFFSITKDTHWGCCLRCGQSMLAQFFSRYIAQASSHFVQHFPTLQDFLTLFDDVDSQPFSIHSLCQALTENGGHEGRWITVSQLAYSIKTILARYDIPVYVAIDSTIVKSEVETLFGNASLPQQPTPEDQSHESLLSSEASSATQSIDLSDISSAPSFKQDFVELITPENCSEDGPIFVFNPKTVAQGSRPVLCLIPLRCGIDTFDMNCLETVNLSLSLPFGLGFISGKGGKAYYIVGKSETDFFYFDPHVTKNCVTSMKVHGQLFGERIKKMPFPEISPSLMMAFFWADKEDMEMTLRALNRLSFHTISISERNNEHKSQGEPEPEWEIVPIPEEMEAQDEGFDFIPKDEVCN